MAVADGAHRVDELVGLGVLEQEPAGAGLEAVEHVVVAVEGGEDEHPAEVLGTRARVASMPSMTGICTSISTTSGRSARACSRAIAPLAASPTTSRSGSTESIIRKPERTRCWSSTMSTRNVGSAAQARSASSGTRTRTR